MFLIDCHNASVFLLLVSGTLLYYCEKWEYLSKVLFTLQTGKHRCQNLPVKINTHTQKKTSLLNIAVMSFKQQSKCFISSFNVVRKYAWDSHRLHEAIFSNVSSQDHVKMGVLKPNTFNVSALGSVLRRSWSIKLNYLPVFVLICGQRTLQNVCLGNASILESKRLLVRDFSPVYACCTGGASAQIDRRMTSRYRESKLV